MGRPKPILHRNDPDSEPLTGNVKVTREDWLNLAKIALIEHGVEGVKVQVLGAELGVSRSSFYWYFKSRQDLLNALLEDWQSTNTAALVHMAETPAATVTEAVGNVFRCAINPALFDTRLDFAVRDWARRAPEVRQSLQNSDAQRLTALQAMFERFDYPREEAIARARILYYMQIGYDDAQLNEPMEERSEMVASYLVGFTGKIPSEDEIAALKAYAASMASDG